MEKRKNTQSQRTNKFSDWAVILLCLLGTFFSFWSFWKDLNLSIQQNQPPVGTITFKQRAAQRRFDDRNLWDRLRRESPVYNGDHIRTAELSDATVAFNDRRKFSLSENTLIQILSLNGKAAIDLASGDISVENPGPLVLVLISGNRQVELSGVMKARAAGDGSFDLAVLEGTAVIRQGNETIVRKAGETLSLGAGGIPEERPQVVMRFPLPDEEFISSGATLEINFSWTPASLTGAELTRLEIASDRRFARILESRDIETSGAALELVPGIYWWRAYAAGPLLIPDSEGSFPQKFIISRAEPPVPALIRPEEAAAGIPLEPEAIAAPVIAAPVPPSPPAAVPARRSRPGPEAALQRPALLPAATERQPENNYRIDPGRLRQSLYLDFRWKAVGGANAYILTLLDGSGRELFKAAPQAETSYTLDLRSLDRGSFVWRLEAVRLNGSVIEQRGMTAENTFTVDLPLPGNPRPNEPGILYGTEP
jgi:hypothetical protein